MGFNLPVVDKTTARGGSKGGRVRVYALNQLLKIAPYYGNLFIIIFIYIMIMPISAIILHSLMLQAYIMPLSKMKFEKI
jgi:hypothetical protein